MKVNAIKEIYRPEKTRLEDYKDVEKSFSKEEISLQSSRCMSCGIPFCHGIGCPLENVIPEMNAAVTAGNWKLAWDILKETSSFPEFTSRVCPALCENVCTNNIDTDPVMIRQIEKLVTETAFENGYIRPFLCESRSGKEVAVIGSGPAGLTAADILNRSGHYVTVFEQNEKPGGLLRYGIPDFKLEKSVIDRRIEIMEQSGIDFQTGTEAGKDISAEYLKRKFDAVVFAAGAPIPRDIKCEGRELKNIRFALDYLREQNKFISGEASKPPINAGNKDVVIIGGGDTGSDCLGTALRQGAKSVVQIDIIPEPPAKRHSATPWPDWPYCLRESSSHKEGGTRIWNKITKEFISEDGKVAGLKIADARWEYSQKGLPVKFNEIPGSETVLKADLVLLAMGFTGVPQKGAAEELKLEINQRGMAEGREEEGIFTCGDARTGQSLVVRAMADAKKTAAKINEYLKR